MDAYPVPGYLPTPARTVLPWAKRKVAHLVTASRVPLADLWDEVITALLRADLTFRPGAGSYTKYAQTCITRGLWRYSLPNTATTQTPGTKRRGIRRNGHQGFHLSLSDLEDHVRDDINDSGTRIPSNPVLVACSPPTPEELALAYEAAALYRAPHPAQPGSRTRTG